MELQADKTYVLTQDVVNPEADKRHKYDATKWPVWKKDSRIQVRQRIVGGWEGCPEFAVKEIYFVESRYSSHSIGEEDPRFALLASFAQPAEETLLTLKKRLGFEYDDILEQLLIDGDISILDIEAAYERCCERWKEEDKAEESQKGNG